MLIAEALQLSLPSKIAFVGAGGKSTAMFQLARQLPPPVILTTSTHLSLKQAALADSHVIVTDSVQLDQAMADPSGVVLLTGLYDGQERVDKLDDGLLYRLQQLTEDRRIPLLIEADGSRLHPLKAPAQHEPAIPPWVDGVIVVAGISGVGKPLTSDWVHRPEIFSELSGILPDQPVTLSGLAAVLIHEHGGLKNIPASAWRVLLLNQADTPELQGLAYGLAGRLLPVYPKVLVASLGMEKSEPDTQAETQGAVHAVVTPVAGVILAAGGSLRMGKPKQLLDWRGETLVRHVAQTALSAGLNSVYVITGAYKEEVERQLAQLPVQLVSNPDWSQGMSTSIRTGMERLPAETGAVIFLLVDQPQIQAGLLRALIETHRRTLAKIIAPIIEGDRANPVLFDRTTFKDLMQLQGDVGGRALFSKYPITYFPWLDADMRLDVDTPQDYQRLLDLE